MYARALDLSMSTGQNQFFSAEQNTQMESDLIHIIPQAAGKYRQQGKEYVVHDGDIIFFKFNAGAGLTAKKK